MTEGKEKQKKWINRLNMLHENEAWLNEQAKKGLILEHFNIDFAYFHEADAEDIKYKIVVINEKKAEDQIKIIERQGFTYIGSSNEYCIFSIDGRFGHIRPRMNEEMILFIRKWFNKQIAKIFLFSLFPMAPLLFALIISRDKLFQTIVEFPVMWSAILVAALVAAIIESLREFQIIQRMKKYICEHEGYEFRWNLKWYAVKKAIAYTIAISIAVISITDVYFDSDKYSIEDIKEIMPIVLIQDIEPDPEQAEIIDESQRSVHEDNFAEIKHTLLAPKQYYARQNFADNGMNINYYELKAEKLAEPLAKGLLVNDIANIKKADIKEMEFKGLDAVYYWQDGDILNVSAIKGNRVMCIFYIGDLQTKALLKEMAEVL